MKHTRSKRTLLSAMLAIAFVPCAALGMRLLMPNAQSASAESTHDTTHSGWTELTADTSALTDGNSYYLAGDTDLAADLTVEGRVTLCLNGHKLAGTGEGSVITVSEGADFTLCDCNGSVNTHYYTVDENTGLYEFGGVTTKTEGAKALEGGVITGGVGTIPATTTNLTGGGIYVDGGTLNMYGGSVAGNTARVGAGLYVMANSTFNMYEGAQITGNSSTSLGGGISTIGTCNIYGGKIDNNTTNGTNYGGGAGIHMNAGTFNMHGGSISHNTAKEYPDWGEAYGGGVALSGGTFTFSGGDISHNIAEGWYYSRGGGIDVLGNGSFKMIEGADGTSGTISYNEAMQGGGISAAQTADLEISAGTISYNIAGYGGGIFAEGLNEDVVLTNVSINNNKAEWDSGGGIFARKCNITIKDSSINNNYADYEGGGIYFVGDMYYDWDNEDYVYVSNDYTLTISGETQISGNTAYIGHGMGGGIYAIYAKLDIRGGKIAENTAASYGGGIYLEDVTATISGGAISGNTANYGGGIFLENATLAMSGGVISENSAGSGGGICVSPGGTLKMSGGKIIKNTAEENAFGGGVYAVYGQNASSGEPADPSIIELSGSPVISGNLAGGIANDLEIDRTNGNKIMITGALRNSAHVGIIDQSDSAETEFSSGYSEHNGTEDPATYFFTDDAVQSVQLSEAGEIEVVTGQYTIVYVDLNGTSSEKSFTIGDDVSLEKVAAQTGYIGGWTTYRGGTSIIYDSEQTITGGLGTRHGETICLYAVQERGLGGDIDRITTGLTEAVEAVNTALEGGTATDLATALSDLADACKAADDALAADLAADLTELKNTLNAAEETIDAAIEGVKKDLGDAVTDLEGAMAAKADSAALAQAIDELTAAYTAADELMSADIDGMEEDMSALEGRLDEALATLQESIHTMQTGLESETERLEGLINASGTDTAELKDALEALDAAYRAADGLLRTDLAAADEALAGEIAADIAELGATLESADEAVRDALDALRAEVDKNASGIAGLTAALWAVGAVAVIALCCAAAGIVLAVKAGKGKKSENGD